MSKEFYDMGYSAGAYVAGVCQRLIGQAKKDKSLGNLAGKRLNHILKNKPKQEDAFVHTNSWATGFFDGFYDKAQDL